MLYFPIDVYSLQISGSDLGRGFSIDEKEYLKEKVYSFDKNNVKIKIFKQSNSTRNLKILTDQESVKSALVISNEFGIISNKVIGDYLDLNSNSGNGEKLTIIYSKRHASKIIKLPKSKMLEDTENINDINSFKSRFGLFYIKKIQYGSFLNIKITLDSNDEELIQRLKRELNGLDDTNKISTIVVPYITSSKLSFKCVVDFGGCQICKSNVQNFNEISDIIKSFKIDQERLVPVVLELSQILIPNNLIEFGEKSFKDYKEKISKVSSYSLELQQTLHQLNRFNSLIKKIKRNENLKVYVDSLFSSVADSISILEEFQEELDSFNFNDMDFILNASIPNSNSIMDEIKKAKKLTGSTFTKTQKGNWFGSSINELPVYEGTYVYNNGSIFKGQCLNGKRHGNGIMTFLDDNKDQLKSIQGKWVNDQLSFPSTITFIDNFTPAIHINSQEQCYKLRIKYKESIMCINKNSVKVTNHSTSDEYRLKIVVNLESIQDELFLEFYQNLKKSIDKHKRYYFIFLGMTGTGKTTLIEFILNILTGQVHSPTTLRAVSLEEKGIGKSKTQSTCSYEIEYVFNSKWKFGITIIDTPGFADVGGLEKDSEHIKSILKTVGKLEKIDSVNYVVNGALTRKTLEPLKVLCNVFSILPNEAFDCVSTFISFCDNSNQANEVRNVLNGMLNGIKERPAVFIDNPWAQHLNNTFRSSHDTPDAAAGTLLGVDNTDELQRKLEAKTQIIQQFIIERIRSKSSFKPAGMEVLHQLKDELLLKLKNLAVIVQDLSTTTNLYKELTESKIESLLETYKTISIEDWLKDRGYALIGGTPKSKIMGTTPWPGGQYSTVCYAPQCLNMVCHQACTVQFTSNKGDNIFTGCDAFNRSENCKVCSSKCSFKQHVHVRFQLEWVENDSVLEAYHSIKMGADEALKKSKDLESKAERLKYQYSQELEEFSELKSKFKNLSVLGDIRIILDSTKRTYEQQHEIAIQIEDQEKADNLQKILDQLNSFIEALKESESSYIGQQMNIIFNASKEKFKQLRNISGYF